MGKSVTLNLAQIDQGIEAILSNAEGLVSEARTLFTMEAFARTFSLAHLAREELSKVGMLRSTATRLLAEHPVNWKKLMSRLRDHKAKSYLEQVENSLLIQGLSDDPAAEMPLKFAGPPVEFRNIQKNDSLYVSIEGGNFITPASRFDSKKAERTLKLAEMRLREQRFYQARLGPYADRQIGSLCGMPIIDQLSPEEIYARVPEVAKIVASLALHRDHEMAANPPFKRTPDGDAVVKR